ncbi:MAG: hypothetical protein JSU08_20285 [Acidobacteria bacterium]|nr:hypothetical protein [Acidobacteriota bacterium]
MRNDSRPMFEHSPASPFGGPDDRPEPSERPDSRDTIAHGRESHIIHPESEKNEPNSPDDPVMPQNDASLNTKI